MASITNDNLDLMADGFYQNPYPVYAWLREHDPVHWSAQFNAWVITRFDDVLSILRDSENFSNAGRQLNVLEQLPAEVQPGLCPIKSFYRQGGLINSDPPQHTRLRRLLQKAFTPRVIEQVRPRVQTLVDSMIDRYCESGQMEVIVDLAKPLPSQVIAEILGAPEKDQAMFGQWADQIAIFLSVPHLNPELALKTQEAILQMKDYFRGLLAERRRDHQKDVLTVMAEVDVETGDALSEQELLASCQNLLLAGQNTTIHLIANTLAMLLEHPAQYQKVVENPEMLKAAIEETLRYNGSAHTVRRRALRDIEMRGKLIRDGDALIVNIGSANHDPMKFARPDEFDITRPAAQNRHIAFGQGIHYCIGASLASLEAEVAVGSVLRRLPNLRLVEPLRWQHTLFERALESLKLSFSSSQLKR